MHDDEAGAPVGPDAGQPDPEDPVPPRQMGSAHGPLEDQKLMAEREVLERRRQPRWRGHAGRSRARSQKASSPRGATWFAPESLRVTEPRCSFRPGKPSGIVDRDRIAIPGTEGHISPAYDRILRAERPPYWSRLRNELMRALRRVDVVVTRTLPSRRPHAELPRLRASPDESRTCCWRRLECQRFATQVEARLAVFEFIASGECGDLHPLSLALRLPGVSCRRSHRCWPSCGR